MPGPAEMTSVLPGAMLHMLPAGLDPVEQSEEVRFMKRWVEEQLAPLRTELSELRERAMGASGGKKAAPPRAECSSHDAPELLAEVPEAGDPGDSVALSSAGGMMSPRMSHASTDAHQVLHRARHEHRDTGYEVQECVWDTTLLIFHKSIPFAESLYALFLVVLNVLIQGVFLIGSLSLAQDSLLTDSAVTGYLDWRFTIAHHPSEMDPISGHSLAQRLCKISTHTGLAQSPFQADAMQSLHTYTKGTIDTGVGVFELPLGLQVGPLMCVMALVVWYALVTTDITESIGLLTAAWMLPTGPLRLAPTGEGVQAEMVSIPTSRKCWVTALMVFRLFMDSCLVYCGTQFLVSSIKVGDLLLNVAALGIIHEIDDLLFACCMSDYFKAAVGSLTPLPRPQRSLSPGMIRLIMVLLFMIPGIWLVVRDVGIRQQCLDAMCAGRKDFVVGTDTAGMPLWIATPEFNTDQDRDCREATAVWERRQTAEGHDNVQVDFIRNTICSTAGEYRGIELPYATGGFFGFESRVDTNFELPCVDSINCLHGGWNTTDMQSCSAAPFEGVPANAWSLYAFWNGNTTQAQTSTWNYVSQMLLDLDKGLEGSLASCSQLEHRCLEDSLMGFRVRQWCPVTCGCSKQASPNWLAVSGMGCPEQCKRWRAIDLFFFNDLWRGNCRDATLEELQGGSGWKGQWVSYWKNWRDSVLAEYPSNARAFYAPFADAAIERGCAQLVDSRTGGPHFYCYAQADRAGAWMWCPQTCGKCLDEAVDPAQLDWTAFGSEVFREDEPEW